MGDKYPDWWPTSMTGPYGGSSGGFDKSNIPKKHGQEGSSYNEKYKPTIRDNGGGKTGLSSDSGRVSVMWGDTDIVKKDGVTYRPVQKNKCPRCGGSLRKRSGRFGTFWGCSNYPKCKYTRN